MCGICGVAWTRTDRIPERSLVDQMCAQIAHRGPDDQGIFTDRTAGLGMRRLSIIDLETGSQPIFNEDRSVCTVFNGEIYNFRQLRSELQTRGHHFTTSSDTEVIVHLYEEYGDEFATPFERHVRDRRLGQPTAPSCSGARSTRAEAFVFLLDQGRPGVRVRAQVPHAM